MTPISSQETAATNNNLGPFIVENVKAIRPNGFNVLLHRNIICACKNYTDSTAVHIQNSKHV